MFIRIFTISPNAFGGCKIRLIFLIIKIMGEYFFGKIIDHINCRARNGIPSDRLAGIAMSGSIRIR